MNISVGYPRYVHTCNTHLVDTCEEVWNKAKTNLYVEPRRAGACNIYACGNTARWAVSALVYHAGD